MVVEILEDKLDHDYIDYISEMILHSPMEIDVEYAEEINTRDMHVKKCDDYPGHWSEMDEREVNKNVSVVHTVIL